MTPEQWQRLQELFDEVTQKPLADRQTALRRVEETVKDPSLLEELRRLVEHAEPDAEFLRPIQAKVAGCAIQVGEVVAGRFEIVRLIGRGGMGQVFEARDRKLDEQVAIKVIAPEFVRDAGLLERFLREVQIARRISHPNICRIHDLGEHGGVPYLSMELLEGETLAKRLEQGPLALPEWEHIARQLFDGLRAAHMAGVIHRDLKPSNLMLVGSRLVILDFGLARPILTRGDSSLTRTGTLIGTLDWMAPEQLLGEYDERSDLYSAALILLQALKGKPSENESSGLAGALRRATGDTDFRKLLPASMTAAWRYVLLRCLERDPDRRPARAQEVQDLLTQRRRLLFAGLGNLARNRWIRISTVTAILLALIILGFRYLNREGLKAGSVIMVASTLNTTGETKLDGITSVLRADLEQSSRFNVWDDQRLGDVLRSMRREALSKPEPKEWREIAVREKAPLLVFSTLSRLGDGYMLAIRSEEIGSAPEPPVHTWTHSVTATGPAGLFEALHDAANWIRSNAGENAADLSANSRLPQDITTNNWEALQLYDQARSLNAARHATEAIPVFQRAIQLDPQFAMALMWLGDLLNGQNKSEEGFAYWRQAIELAHAQHLSDHETLNIEGRYYIEIKDFKAAEPVLLDWTRRFPNDSLAPRLLASALFGQGRYEDAISAARGAQQRFGPTVFGTSILIRGLAARNQLADVEAQIQVLESLSAHAVALRFGGMTAAMRGDYDEAARLFRELASTAQGEAASRAIGLLAILEADRGRMDEAYNILSAAISRDRDAGEYGLASQKTAALAFLEGIRGNRESARTRVQEAVSVAGPSPQVILESVTILARNGYVDDAVRLMKRFPSGEGPGFDAALDRMQGEIAAARGELQNAVELLDRAASTDRPRDPKEYLARVLDLAGYRERAKSIYQNIADTPWVIWASPEDVWPGTRFIARQYLLKAKGE
jgi:serine/threonine protein kinase/Flp pilus assembly protein TadD